LGRCTSPIELLLTQPHISAEYNVPVVFWQVDSAIWNQHIRFARATGRGLATLGRDSQTMSQYFERNGAPKCPQQAIRAALHKAPFLICNTPYRHKVTDHLEALVSAAQQAEIPDDMAADAQYLFDRWMREDFDPDLLRDIHKTLRVVDKKRMTTQSLDKDYRFKRSAGIPGHNGLVVSQYKNAAEYKSRVSGIFSATRSSLSFATPLHAFAPL
jgi:hypothetical protein